MKVLVVDDADDVRLSLRLSLTAAGYDVVEAHDGRSALCILAETSINCIIADIWMPHMDGIELLQRVRDAAGDIPVFVITGGTSSIPMESTAAMARTWGAAAVFLKPFDNDELIAHINELIPS